MNLNKDIDKCNEALATFMGYVFKRGKFTTELSNSSGEYYYALVEDEIWWDENDNPLEHGLDFYSNWERLMEVVEKIEGLSGEQYEVDVFKNYCHITNISNNSSGPYIKVIGGRKREAVYEACYKFIIDYTQNENS